MRSWSLGVWQTSGTAVPTNQKADLVLAIQCRSYKEIADLVLALTTLYCETYQNIVCVCDAECCTEHTQHSMLCIQHSMLCMFSAALSITDANLCEHRPLIPCEYGILLALVCQRYLDSPNMDSPNLDGRQLRKDMNILVYEVGVQLLRFVTRALEQCRKGESKIGWAGLKFVLQSGNRAQIETEPYAHMLRLLVVWSYQNTH